MRKYKMIAACIVLCVSQILGQTSMVCADLNEASNKMNECYEEEIATISTEQLYCEVLDDPEMTELFCYGTTEEALAELKVKIPKLNELLQRDNLKDIVLKNYQDNKIPLTCYADYTQIDKNNYDKSLTQFLSSKENCLKLEKDYKIILKEQISETILAQENIYTQATTQERKLIIATLFKKIKQKEQSKLFENVNKSDFLYIINYSKNKDGWRRFISEETPEKEKIKFFSKDGSIVVKTPRGTKLTKGKEYLVYSDNHVNSDTYVAEYKAKHDKYKIISNGHTRANCHAYSWPRRYDIWLNDPSPYWSDGSYYETSRPVMGGRILYGITENRMAHSAIVVANAGKIEHRVKGQPFYNPTVRSKIKSGPIIETESVEFMNLFGSVMSFYC